MRVLQINSVCGYGSTGRIAIDIHNTLRKRGHESFIAFGRGDAIGIDEKYVIKIGNKLDFYSHALQSRILDNHGVCVPFSLSAWRAPVWEDFEGVKSQPSREYSV